MKRILIITAIFVLALSIRLSAVYNYNRVIESDEIEYDRLAMNIVEGKGYINSDDGAPTALRPPFYAATLALLYSIFGHSYLVVRVAQALAGALTVIVLYMTAEHIFNKTTAILAGIFASFYMPFVACAKLLYTETFFTLLMTLIILLVLVVEPRRLSFIFLIGFLSGLLALLRSNGLFIFLAIVLWFLVKLRSGKSYLKKALPVIITLFAAFLLVILPWTARNYKVFGKPVFVSTNAGLNMYQALVKTPGKIYEISPSDPVLLKALKIPDEAVRNSFYVKSALKTYRDKPVHAARMLSLRFLFFWSLIDWEVTGASVINYHLLFILPFIVPGLLFAYKDRKDIALISLVLLSFMALILLFPGYARYRMPADGYVIMLGCYGAWELVRRAGKKISLPLFGIGAYYLWAYMLYRNSLCVKEFLKGLAGKTGLW